MRMHSPPHPGRIVRRGHRTAPAASGTLTASAGRVASFTCEPTGGPDSGILPWARRGRGWAPIGEVT